MGSLRNLWNGKQTEDLPAPELKQWNHIDLLFTGMMIVGSGCVVTALFLIGWNLAGL